MSDHMYNYYPGSSATVQASTPSRIVLDKKRIKYAQYQLFFNYKAVSAYSAGVKS